MEKSKDELGNLLIDGGKVLIGFREAEWKEVLKWQAYFHIKDFRQGGNFYSEKPQTTKLTCFEAKLK